MPRLPTEGNLDAGYPHYIIHTVFLHQAKWGITVLTNQIGRLEIKRPKSAGLININFSNILIFRSLSTLSFTPTVPVHRVKARARRRRET